MKRVILASQSPRRRELMADTGFSFVAKTSAAEEYFDPALDVYQAVEQIAYQKAAAVLKQYPGDVILGADTIVYNNHEVMGKPANKEEAFQMLKKLSGSQHEVITGVAILTGDVQDVFHVITNVTFYELSDEEILDYIDTKEPMDKAGAYGIQGLGKFLVAKIEGDYYNVVGLPMALVYRKLKLYLK